MSLKPDGAARRLVGTTRPTVEDATFAERRRNVRTAAQLLYGGDPQTLIESEQTTRNGVIFALRAGCDLTDKHAETFKRADPYCRVAVENNRVVVRVVRLGAIQTPSERAITRLTRLRRVAAVLMLACYGALVYALPQKYARWPHCVAGAPALLGC